MVNLTLTEAMIASINFCVQNAVPDWPPEKLADDPQLDEPALGKPISHSQVITLSKCLRVYLKGIEDGSLGKTSTAPACDLDTLLRGSQVYIEPPKPKTKPVRQSFISFVILLISWE